MDERCLPLTEDSPLRERRFVDGPEYENLEMEERYLPRGATVLRLGAVHGEHDYQRRFEFVLRRVRAGRSGSRWAPCSSSSAACTSATWRRRSPWPWRGITGVEAFNVVERLTAPYRLFAEQILAAADASDVELVRVSDEKLPSDLQLTGVLSQHLLMDPGKARTVLGWEPVDPAAGPRESVRWHLANPPVDASDDFSADDALLE